MRVYQGLTNQVGEMFTRRPITKAFMSDGHFDGLAPVYRQTALPLAAGKGQQVLSVILTLKQGGESTAEENGGLRACSSAMTSQCSEC